MTAAEAEDLEARTDALAATVAANLASVRERIGAAGGDRP